LKEVTIVQTERGSRGRGPSKTEDLQLDKKRRYQRRHMGGATRPSKFKRRGLGVFTPWLGDESTEKHWALAWEKRKDIPQIPEKVEKKGPEHEKVRKTNAVMGK